MNDTGQLCKDYELIADDPPVHRFNQDRRTSRSGGFEKRVTDASNAFCHNCLEGKSEPLNEEQRDSFLDDYLGEYTRMKKDWSRKARQEAQQEDLIAHFSKGGTETEVWPEAD